MQRDGKRQLPELVLCSAQVQPRSSIRSAGREDHKIAWLGRPHTTTASEVSRVSGAAVACFQQHSSSSWGMKSTLELRGSRPLSSDDPGPGLLGHGANPQQA